MQAALGRTKGAEEVDESVVAMTMLGKVRKRISLNASNRGVVIHSPLHLHPFPCPLCSAFEVVASHTLWVQVCKFAYLPPSGRGYSQQSGTLTPRG